MPQCYPKIIAKVMPLSTIEAGKSWYIVSHSAVPLLRAQRMNYGVLKSTAYPQHTMVTCLNHVAFEHSRDVYIVLLCCRTGLLLQKETLPLTPCFRSGAAKAEADPDRSPRAASSSIISGFGDFYPAACAGCSGFVGICLLVRATWPL